MACVPAAALIDTVHRNELLNAELTDWLAMVERAAKVMVDDAAVYAEHERAPAPEYVASIGRMGQAMVGAVERTRSLLEQADE